MNNETKPSDIAESLGIVIFMTIVLQLFDFSFIQILWINCITAIAYLFLKQRSCVEQKEL
jgi:hypothetical protein